MVGSVRVLSIAVAVVLASGHVKGQQQRVITDPNELRRIVKDTKQTAFVLKEYRSIKGPKATCRSVFVNRIVPSANDPLAILPVTAVTERGSGADQLAIVVTGKVATLGSSDLLAAGRPQGISCGVVVDNAERLVLSCYDRPRATQRSLFLNRPKGVAVFVESIDGSLPQTETTYYQCEP